MCLRQSSNHCGQGSESVGDDTSSAWTRAAAATAYTPHRYFIPAYLAPPRLDLSVHLNAIAPIAAVLAVVQRVLGQEDDGSAELRRLALFHELVPVRTGRRGKGQCKDSVRTVQGRFKDGLRTI